MLYLELVPLAAFAGAIVFALVAVFAKEKR
jgi:hypothetical protein